MNGRRRSVMGAWCATRGRVNHGCVACHPRPAIEIAPMGLRPVVPLQGRYLYDSSAFPLVHADHSSAEADDRPEARSPEFIRRGLDVTRRRDGTRPGRSPRGVAMGRAPAGRHTARGTPAGGGSMMGAWHATRGRRLKSRLWARCRRSLCRDDIFTTRRLSHSSTPITRPRRRTTGRRPGAPNSFGGARYHATPRRDAPRPVATRRGRWNARPWFWASLLVAVLALFCLGVIRASAAPRAVSAAAYWQKLSDTHALAVRLEGQPAGATQAQLAAAADEWAGITSVTLADGTVLPIEI